MKRKKVDNGIMSNKYYSKWQNVENKKIQWRARGAEKIREK
jgi:hypothetical protein